MCKGPGEGTEKWSWRAWEARHDGETLLELDSVGHGDTAAPLKWSPSVGLHRGVMASIWHLLQFTRLAMWRERGWEQGDQAGSSEE